MRVTNYSDYACTAIKAMLRLPSQCRLISGSPSIHLRQLAARDSVTTTIQIVVTEAGRFAIQLPTLSYRDGTGRTQLELDGPPIMIEAEGTGSSDTPPVELVPILSSSHLMRGQWQELSGIVKHRAGPRVARARLRLIPGALVTDTSAAPIDLGSIDPGKSVPFTVLVRSSESGTAVSAVIEIEHADEFGRRRVDEAQTALKVIDVQAASQRTAASRSDGPGRPARPRMILFVTADPLDNPLDSSREFVEIETAIDRSDHYVLVPCQAARPDRLVTAVRRHRPTVVHFSGHGTKLGIELRSHALNRQEVQWTGDERRILEDQGPIEVEAEAMREFFRDRGVELVVLHCCYSAVYANNIAETVPTVVATPVKLNDAAAIDFSREFYRSLADGATITEAFRDGQDTVSMSRHSDRFLCVGDADRTLPPPRSGPGFHK